MIISLDKMFEDIFEVLIQKICFGGSIKYQEIANYKAPSPIGFNSQISNITL